MGKPKTAIYKTCPVCSTEFKTYPLREKTTCSRECMGIYQTGENNPNYGKSWSAQQREHLSTVKLASRDEISARVTKDWENNSARREAASALQSKLAKEKFGPKNPFYGKTHTEKTKMLIGSKSSEKFTEEFKKTFRTAMEEKGLWRELKDIPEYELYAKEADWICGMWNLVSPGSLKELGVFNPITNHKGCVRDHILGRSAGFKLNIPTILLRHPENCQIIPSSENVRKAQSGQKDDQHLTIQELIMRIQTTKIPWEEQALCEEAIQEYQQVQGGIS